ncbi:hypothetical protein ACFLRF_03260 [Candidatus Altiarchaeota archaeon]
MILFSGLASARGECGSDSDCGENEYVCDGNLITNVTHECRFGPGGLGECIRHVTPVITCVDDPGYMCTSDYSRTRWLRSCVDGRSTCIRRPRIDRCSHSPDYKCNGLTWEKYEGRCVND